MNIYLKKCRKCGSGFDQGINKDLCPNCRLEILEEVNKNWWKRNQRKKVLDNGK